MSNQNDEFMHQLQQGSERIDRRRVANAREVTQNWRRFHHNRRAMRRWAEIVDATVAQDQGIFGNPIDPSTVNHVEAPPPPADAPNFFEPREEVEEAAPLTYPQFVRGRWGEVLAIDHGDGRIEYFGRAAHQFGDLNQPKPLVIQAGLAAAKNFKQDQCPVCLEDQQVHPICRRGHQACANCETMWKQVQRGEANCPLCRGKLIGGKCKKCKGCPICAGI